jgi:O-acetyl-ADP-ribose deacetylase (regulator of RNase III)
MIHYLVGDATDPQGDSIKIIAHVCNDRGGWGRGFVVSLSKRYHYPEWAYRRWAKGYAPYNVAYGFHEPFALGETQFVGLFSPGEPVVANMIAQAGYGVGNKALHAGDEPNETPPIRYDALRKCLMTVAQCARIHNATVHMPRIGCGLAGGKWEIVEQIIQETLSEIDVFVYDLPTENDSTPVQTDQ